MGLACTDVSAVCETLPQLPPKVKAVRELLLTDYTLTDTAIAETVRCPHATVKATRRHMYEAGELVKPLSAKEKRAKVVELLLNGQKLSDGAIAAHVGVTRRTVLTTRQKLHQQGTEVALHDGRKDNGDTQNRYDERVWKLIDELKAKHEGWGGRQLHFHLTSELGCEDEELPSVSRIECYLSEKGLVKPKLTAKTDRRPYYMEDYRAPMVRCGMDCQTVQYGASRTQVTVVSVIDFWSRAVYSEVFAWDAVTSHYKGVSPATFAGVFLRFCQAFGCPKVLVLDNGAGQVTSHGWLPDVVKLACFLGVRVEWEPYGRPWRNGAIENWHRHSQEWWLPISHTYRSYEAVQVAWRRRAWLYTTRWRQRKLNNCTAKDLLPQCNPWPLEGPEAGPLPIPYAADCDHEWEGTISVQREVEKRGYVKIHGNDHVFVSPMLWGGYVRIDFRVMPKGQPGFGQVLDGKGRLVGNFRHRMECKRKPGEPLVYDMNAVGYALEGDIRKAQEVAPGYMDQQAYNQFIESAQKNQRSIEDYAQTESLPVMRSRKSSAQKKGGKQ